MDQAPSWTTAPLAKWLASSGAETARCASHAAQKPTPPSEIPRALAPAYEAGDVDLVMGTGQMMAENEAPLSEIASAATSEASSANEQPPTSHFKEPAARWLAEMEMQYM